MGKSRNQKIKTVPVRELEDDVFFLSLGEAKLMLRDEYEFLQDRHERSKVARKRLPA